MNCIKATLPLRREGRARPAQGLSAVQILNMFTSRCRLFTPKSIQKGVLPCKQSLLFPSPLWFSLFEVTLLFSLDPYFFWGGLFIYFKSILMYTGKTEKKILYFDLFGLCPRMKNCISPVNFYVKTILHQCNVSKKSSTLVQFLCFPSLASIATNFTEGSLHDRL